MTHFRGRRFILWPSTLLDFRLKNFNKEGSHAINLSISSRWWDNVRGRSQETNRKIIYQGDLCVCVWTITTLPCRCLPKANPTDGHAHPLFYCDTIMATPWAYCSSYTPPVPTLVYGLSGGVIGRRREREWGVVIRNCHAGARGSVGTYRGSVSGASAR